MDQESISLYPGLIGSSPLPYLRSNISKPLRTASNLILFETERPLAEWKPDVKGWDEKRERREGGRRPVVKKGRDAGRVL